VRDTGAGIPERALKQIFDPFFSTKVSGSGLGLAVTLRIVRDHGGSIDVFSNEGQGTRFIMNLPFKEPPDTETHVPTFLAVSENENTESQPTNESETVPQTADRPSAT